jgi:hypothetical protein
VTFCVEFIEREFVIEKVSFNRFVLCCVSHHSMQLLFNTKNGFNMSFSHFVSVFIVGIVNVKIKWTETLNSFYVFVNIHICRSKN